jgi:hypothetical protein
VIDLDSGTSYDFQVFATNAGGAGPASVPLTQSTAAATGAAPAAAGGPAQVTGLTAMVVGDRSIELRWAPIAPGPDAYSVQYRTKGTSAWATYSTSASTPAVVDGLDCGSTYEFQVFAVTAGVAGSPSSLVGATTQERVPRWSDLIMSTDKAAEVDLARLQMLAFTTIAAVFTGLTLINTGTIPEIPTGELALVGVSNGVYLAAKAAGKSTR